MRQAPLAEPPGGSESFSQAFEADRRWFAHRHGRRHRIRDPLEGEHAAFCNPLPGCVAVFVVKKLRPNILVQLPVWVEARPLNSEGVAASLFNHAAEHYPEVALLEAAVREGLL